MFIKRWLVALSLGALFMGCSNESQVFQESPVVKVQGVTCIRNMQEIFTKYFVSKMGVDELAEFWDCTDRAVQIFDRYFEGEKSRYTPRKIYEFLNYFFFSDLKIPDNQVDALLEELMHFKRVLVGGDSRYITSGELVKLREWIQYLKKETILLQPHISILNWVHGESPPSLERLNLSKSVLNSVAKRLGERFGREGVSYSKENIESLFEKMDILFESEPDRKMDLQRWVPLVFHVKEILFGGDLQAIEPEAWRPLVLNVSRGFGTYLTWNYAVSPATPWYEPTAIEGLDLIVKEGLGILREGMEVQKSRTISNSTVLSIFKDLERLEILPKEWGSADLSHLWLVLTSQILSEEFEGRGLWIKLRDRWLRDKKIGWEKAIEGLFSEMDSVADSLFPSLSLEMVQRVEDEFLLWSSTQRLINSEKSEFGSRKCLNPSSDPVNEMVCLLKNPWPLNLDSEGRLLFQRGEGRYNWPTLSTLNWERAVMRALIHGYGDQFSLNRSPTGVSEGQLESLFFDLKPVLVKFSLVDSSNLNFFERIFLEGNLFLARSDGDRSALSFNESIEYLHYALAGV
ncbi:hypothetical protein OAQ84_01985, partial [Bdellovibrionales bacterium]|nr:hypothetical protein [Bdellovibrionales bacterium]